jgi:hypothetical protein
MDGGEEVMPERSLSVSSRDGCAWSALGLAPGTVRYLHPLNGIGCTVIHRDVRLASICFAPFNLLLLAMFMPPPRPAPMRNLVQQCVSRLADAQSPAADALRSKVCAVLPRNPAEEGCSNRCILMDGASPTPRPTASHNRGTRASVSSGS